MARAPFRHLLPLAALAVGVRLALCPAPAWAQDAPDRSPALASEAPARVTLVVFDGARPLAGAELGIDDAPRGRTGTDGAAQIELSAGRYELTVAHAGTEALRIPLSLQAGESVEIIATLRPDAEPEVAVDSSHRDGAVASDTSAEPEEAGPPGVLAGRIVDSEQGRPVAGARVYLSGTPLDIQTDADGRFSARLAPGRYGLSIIAPGYSTLTRDDVAVSSDETTEHAFELTPSGLELPEFVVLEPYVEGSLAAFVEERRASAAVTDVLGAEQISRQGDSDAAGALRRVTGLTLVDGKYVYVRGLGERYSSVLLNGAQIPSPDPTRRVVPLDLFPTDVLSGVVIQKTYSADMPGEFAGGTVQLRTRSFPDAFFLRIGGSMGWVDGATGETGRSYDGGSRDWTGFDDGSRALPDTLQEATAGGRFIRPRTTFNPDGFSAAEIEGFGENLAALGYDTHETSVAPDHGLSASTGNAFDFGNGHRWGVLAALRYSSSGDLTDEERRTYSASNAGLALKDQFEVQRTRRNVDLSAFVNLGLELGDRHRLSANTMLLRQSEDEVSLLQGESDSQFLQRYRLQWTENALRTNQLLGEHALPWWNLGLDWSWTDSRASRHEPNTREYRRDLVGDEYLFSTRSDNNSQRFADLSDDARDWTLDLELPFALGDASSLKLHAGLSAVERSRDSTLRTFKFGGSGAFLDTALRRGSLEDILHPDNIGSGRFVLQDQTKPTDNYTATQTLDARHLGADLALFDRWRIAVGVREEDNRQTVLTRDLTNPEAPPIVGEIDQVDRLPSVAVTWWQTGDAQWRFGYGKSVSRPDFRELSAAPFRDPLLDLVTVGNPDLVAATIDNLDLRWEYYFSPTESLSVAAFHKDFTQPIEKTLSSGGSTSILTLQNALGAEVYGIEFDVHKQLGFIGEWPFVRGGRLGGIDWSSYHVSANYARIESSVQIDTRLSIQTNPDRPLQGQSPYVANLQLGHTRPDGRGDWTLLYNMSGERIAQAGVQGQPDILEQPLPQLDFVWRRTLGTEWELKLRLRNLLDPDVEFTQGGQVTRSYRKGREIVIGLEWRPDF